MRSNFAAAATKIPSNPGALFTLKTLRTTTSILALTLTAFSLVSAQQAVSPPPKPADGGPSLAVTMQFIQDKLNQHGKINFAEYVQDNAAGNDWIVQQALEIVNVVIHPESCIISYHFKEWTNNNIGTEVADAKICRVSLH
jgi:hypothetical protein